MPLLLQMVAQDALLLLCLWSCLEASWRVQSNHPKGYLLSSFPSLASLCPPQPRWAGKELCKPSSFHLPLAGERYWWNCFSGCTWHDYRASVQARQCSLAFRQSRFPAYRLRPLYMWDHLSRALSQCGGLSFDTKIHSHGSSLCCEELITTTGTCQLHHRPTAHCRQLCLCLLQWKLSQLRGHQKMQQTSDYSNALWEYWSSNHKEHEKIHRFPIFMSCGFLFFLWNFCLW